jgi:tetratricopeptide (TPR) repeat protein
MTEPDSHQDHPINPDGIPGNGQENACSSLSREADDDLRSWLDQALILIHEGSFEQAEEMYRFLIEMGVEHDKVYTNLAGLCQLKGAHDESMPLLELALKLNPESAQAHLLIANIMEARGDYGVAITKIQHALQLDDKLAEAHHNMGFILAHLNDHTGAVDCYLRATEIREHYPDAHNNLGNSLKALGRFDGAMSAYDQAISQKHNFADAHLNRALLMLLQENYAQGWQEYEWRLQRNATAIGMPHAIPPSCRRWAGETLNAADPLLLVAEQGLGDTIQMIRYVNTLRQRGHPITLAAQDCLHAIIRCSSIDAVLIRPDELDGCSSGFWLPLFSLPSLLEVTPENPIVANPYLHSDRSRISQWQSILEPEARPVVAINWQGNPTAEKFGLRGRSFALELLAPVASRLRGSLLSLQKGYGSEQLESCSFKEHFVQCQQLIGSRWDFLDVAAIIANCDLVITSDTCIAHLAGAMGHPTWLLLPMIPDWRWGLEKESSFWYPSIRIFRQKTAGDWAGVIRNVLNALREQDFCT